MTLPCLQHLRLTSAALALAALLGGCADKTPKGQVVAVVDGEEVTRREVAAEPQVANLPQGDTAQPMLAAVLSGVVDRKLATAEAKRLELDRTPQYVAQSKRLQEVMLSRTLFDRWADEVPAPSPRAMKDFIDRNPQRFGARKLFLIDRIETTGDQSQTEALAPMQSNDAIAAYFKSRSQPYRRTRTVIDSATLPLALFRQISALAPGYPLAMVQNNGIVILAVVETRDAPLTPEETKVETIKALKQVAVQENLSALRKKAKVAYQPGYRPAASLAADTQRGEPAPSKQ
jgi:EpsD family peptidyl-prolyl cis-trans isomerase